MGVGTDRHLMWPRKETQKVTTCKLSALMWNDYLLCKNRRENSLVTFGAMNNDPKSSSGSETPTPATGVENKPMLSHMLGNVACNFRNTLWPLPRTSSLAPALALRLAAASPSPEKAGSFLSHSTDFLLQAASHHPDFFLSLPNSAP